MERTKGKGSRGMKEKETKHKRRKQDLKEIERNKKWKKKQRTVKIDGTNWKCRERERWKNNKKKNIKTKNNEENMRTKIRTKKYKKQSKCRKQKI